MLRPQSLTGNDGWGVLVESKPQGKATEQKIGDRGRGGGVSAYCRPLRKRPVSAVAGCQGSLLIYTGRGQVCSG